ncbi:gamma-glutamyltransferase [Roseiarcaceae bacterium H3SJ34-1]|uniref:gamma-glutamyltransferase family protein n=1 Tax=Terripilifer ovatus TaxID=3032367 RepID=UPI003AB94B07|nr:gamma-glutamyltransferase [Roseiarcaceae bacterium H3SJ34-1]
MSQNQTFSFAAVAAPRDLACRAGQAILIEGGNAIEAAIAMAAVMAVVAPHLNSLGGDGFWLIREPRGRVRAVEAAGASGALATIRRWRDSGHDVIPSRGVWSAMTVPGMVGGWIEAMELAHALGGKLPLDMLLAPAIAHARDGYPVAAGEGRMQPFDLAALKDAPGFADAFLADGKLPPAGTMRTAPALASTLQQLAHAGLKDFYRGDVAREMAGDMERMGMPVTRGDLKDFAAKWRTPLALKMRDATVYAPPPPSPGIAALVTLGVAERLGIAQPDSFAFFHGLLEAGKRGFAARAGAMMDFDGLDVDHDAFLASDFLAREAEAISSRRAAEIRLDECDERPAWIGAMDADGLAVSCLQSAGWHYGSGCVLPGTGILLQNRGSAFSLDQNSPRMLAPGRRPVHGLAPSLAVFRDAALMSFGASGGEAQPQILAQVFVRIAMGMTPEEAVAAPRCALRRMPGDVSTMLDIEAEFDPSIARQLRQSGHEIRDTADISDHSLGEAGVMIRRSKGAIDAGTDPRGDSAVSGL